MEQQCCFVLDNREIPAVKKCLVLLTSRCWDEPFLVSLFPGPPPLQKRPLSVTGSARQTQTTFFCLRQAHFFFFFFSFPSPESDCRLTSATVPLCCFSLLPPQPEAEGFFCRHGAGPVCLLLSKFPPPRDGGVGWLHSKKKAGSLLVAGERD